MALIKKTLVVRLWTLFKVPMLFISSPVVYVLNEKRTEISIRLRYFTRNHFKSMYIGALVGGADLASGLLAMEIAKNRKEKVLPLFKDLQASFYKRAMGRTVFVCEDGERISKAVSLAAESGERHNLTVGIRAFCPEISDETVAEFKMTISLKKA